MHIHTPEATTLEDDDSVYFCSLIIGSLDAETKTEALVRLLIQSKQCKMKLTCKSDTGPQGNAIHIATYKDLHSRSQCNECGILVNIQPSNIKITAYVDHKVTLYRVCTLKLTFGILTRSVTFYVVKATDPIIIGFCA